MNKDKVHHFTPTSTTTDPLRPLATKPQPSTSDQSASNSASAGDGAEPDPTTGPDEWAER